MTTTVGRVVAAGVMVCVLAVVAPADQVPRATAGFLAADPRAVSDGDDRPVAVVTRLAGQERSATAAAMAADAWVQSERAVIVDGGLAMEALIGAHLAARLDVPVLLSGTAVPAPTSRAMADLDVRSVIAIGAAAVPDGVQVSRLDVSPADVAALSALAVEAHPGDNRAPVILASAATFADALAAANLAPARLLLTDPGALSPAVAHALDALAVQDVLILGGAAAVAPAVEDEVSAMGIRTVRIAGTDRIDTALLAAHRAGGTAALASAADFADAVALVPWAGRRDAAVLLTWHAELPAAVEGRLRHVEHAAVVVAGGTAAIGNFVDRQAAAALVAAPPPGFIGRVRALTQEDRSAMVGVTWHDGCPVSLDDLRAIEAEHWLPDGNVEAGTLVVHADVADPVAGVLGHLFDARFPITSLRPARDFGGDDDASMAADNTSGFNCRVVAGTTRWSQHAYGRAIDVNPVRNPFVRGATVDPPAGAAYVDRSDVRPGMLVDGGPVVAAFDAIGWSWGGRWVSAKDYQHVSLTGG